MEIINYTRTYQDYLNELNEQLELLCDYCRQMDQGNLRYAKPLATLVRVLVHQTPKSNSLFYLMGKQQSMKFCSSSKTYQNKKNIIYLVTLIHVAKKISFELDGLKIKPVYVPNLDRNINHMRWLKYDDWYENIVFINNKENNDGLIKLEQEPGSKLTISRKKIITYFANKAGGAHFSKKVDEDLYYLSKSLSSMEYEDVKPQNLYKPGEKYVPGIPIENSLHAALRQIAYELIQTIVREFGLKPTYVGTHKDILGYDVDKAAYEMCVRFNPKTREVSTTH